MQDLLRSQTLGRAVPGAGAGIAIAPTEALTETC
jgi:hypothetical protein